MKQKRIDLADQNINQSVLCDRYLKRKSALQHEPILIEPQKKGVKNYDN